MALFTMAAKVKPKKVTSQVLPPIVKGENSVQNTLLTDDGFAKALVNFKYVGNMLQLGRGGLVKQTDTTTGDVAIVDICKSNGVLYVATASNVYSVVSGVVTQKFTVTAAPQLINFNENLIVCDSGRTQLYDGTNLYYIGSHLDTITGGTVSTGQDILTTYAGSWTPADDGRKRKVLMLTAWMKCTGSPTSISVTLNSETSASVLMSEIGTEYQLVDFEFTNPPVLLPNTAYTITYTTIGGGASDYFTLGQTATDDMIQLNGSYAPKATTGLVHNSVLWLAGDTDNPERAYISNVNLADDFFTDHVAGYVSFCDSSDGTITGLSMVYNQVGLTGVDNGVPTTTLIDDTYAISHKFIGGNSNRFAFLGSKSALFFVTDEGMSVSQGNDMFGDLSFNLISKYIQDRFDGSNSDNTFVAYMPSLNQIWVKLDTETDVQVFNLEGGQWTRYRFKNITPSSFREINGTPYVGSTVGNLYKLDPDTLTDDGTAIDYVFTTKAYKLAAFSQVVFKEFQIEVISGSSFSGSLTASWAYSSFDTTLTISSSKENLHYRVKLVGDYIDFTMSNITTNSIPLIFGNIIVGFVASGRKIT